MLEKTMSNNIQVVNATEDEVLCIKCGNNIVELGHSQYSGIAINGASTRDENCRCRECKTKFILHYDLFDHEGHVCSWVFSGDPNDLNHDWQDKLECDQKKEVGTHLQHCITCQRRRDEESLSDGWFASIIHKSK